MGNLIFGLSFLIYSLIIPVIGDAPIEEGTDYYISSEHGINSGIYNLVDASDGTSDFPAVLPDSSGSPVYGKWQVTSLSSSLFQLRCDTGHFLDIKGGTSTSPNNPKPFTNTASSSSLNGQAWQLTLISGAGLDNQAQGVSVIIYNPAWKVALQPQAGQSVSVTVGPIPTLTHPAPNQLWFFASVTTRISTTATVTQTKTATGPTTTLTVNANGPTSTITSTVLQTQETTIYVTTSSPARRSAAAAPHPLMKRFDFTTTTITSTSTKTTTTSVGGPITSVTHSGGFVYVTATVTNTIHNTITSTIFTAPQTDSDTTPAPSQTIITEQQTVTQQVTTTAQPTTGAGSGTSNSDSQTSSSGSGSVATTSAPSVAPVSAATGGSSPSTSSSSSPTATNQSNSGCRKDIGHSFLWGIWWSYTLVLLSWSLF